MFWVSHSFYMLWASLTVDMFWVCLTVEMFWVWFLFRVSLIFDMLWVPHTVDMFWVCLTFEMFWVSLTLKFIIFTVSFTFEMFQVSLIFIIFTISLTWGVQTPFPPPPGAGTEPQTSSPLPPTQQSKSGFIPGSKRSLFIHRVLYCTSVTLKLIYWLNMVQYYMYVIFSNLER